MGCRVKVRLKSEDRVVETVALLNSGFETDAPDIVIPVELAKRLNLWPPKDRTSTILDTGGGEISVPYRELPIELELLLNDRENKKVLVNVIVNPYIHEVLISDYVTSLLRIILLDFKRGLWRLNDDPRDRVRGSYEAEEW